MFLLLLWGCQPVAGAVDEPCPCSQIALPDGPVTDEAGVASLLAATVEAAWPELSALTIDVGAVEDLAYFRAVIDLETLDPEDASGRVYRVEYDPVVLTDPPAPEALAAVLAHELGHVSDYVAMSGTEYLAFGVWYGSQDPLTSEELAAYERGTDEAALTRGCADGLSAMREWIYAHASEEIEAEKRRNYYSPEEIAAWVAANGGCA